MSAVESSKREAAERAVALVEDGMTLGLGTGSTARLVLEAIARRRETGELRDIVGVATSRETETRARELGIPLTTLDQRQRLALTLDGADEVDPRLDLIKGLGGALLWEKIVAAASERLVIVVDAGKRVERLGTRAPLPLEVVPFGWRTHLDAARELGAEPALRTKASGEPVRTDSGNLILDCRFPQGISDAPSVHRAFKARPGVVETGLFLGMADAVVVGTGHGAQLLERARSAAPAR